MSHCELKWEIPTYNHPVFKTNQDREKREIIANSVAGPASEGDDAK